jgi:hypothetical protein
VSDLFLGVIAVAVALMTAIQLAAVVFAIRAARRVGDAVTRLEQDMKPIVANLQAISSDAARVTTAAAVQVERAGALILELTTRVDQAAATLQATIVTPVREIIAVVRGIIAALAVFRPAASAPSARPAPSDEEDSLFIG